MLRGIKAHELYLPPPLLPELLVAAEAYRAPMNAAFR